MPLAPELTGSVMDQPTRADSLPEPIAADAAPQSIGQVPPAPQQPPRWDDLQSALKGVSDEDKSHAVEAWRDTVSRYGYEHTAWSQDDEDGLKRFADEEQKRIASEVKFERGDKPYKHLANDFLLDPQRPGDGLMEAWRDGVIPRPSNEQFMNAFAVQDQMRQQAEQQRLAGGNQKLKAAGVGLGRGLAFATGAMGGAKVATFGTALIPVVGETVVAPIVAGLIGGAVGGTITAAGYDEVVRANFEGALAASQLHPNITAAGELTAFVIPGIAGAAKGVKRFALVAENLGKKEALKQAATYVAVSGGIGAASAPVMSAIDRWKNAVLDLDHEPQADLFDPKSIVANTVLAIMLGNLGVKFTKFNAGEAASIHQRGMAGQKLSPAEKEMFDTINRKMAQDPNSFVFEAEQATFRNPKTGEQMPMSGAGAARTQRNPAQPQQPAGGLGGGAPPPTGGAAPPPRQGAPPPRSGQQQQPGGQSPPPRQPGAAPRRFNSQQEFNDFMDAASARGDAAAGAEAWKTANVMGEKRWLPEWMKSNAGNSEASWFANSVVSGRSNADHATFVNQQQFAASAKAAPRASAAAAASAGPPPVAGVPGGQQGRPGEVPSVPRGGAPVVAAEPAAPIAGAPKTTAALAGTVVPLPVAPAPISPAPESAPTPEQPPSVAGALSPEPTRTEPSPVATPAAAVPEVAVPGAKGDITGMLRDIVEGKPVTLYHGSYRSQPLTELKAGSSMTTHLPTAETFGKTGAVYEGKVAIPSDSPIAWRAKGLLDDIESGKITPEEAKAEFDASVTEYQPTEAVPVTVRKPTPAPGAKLTPKQQDELTWAKGTLAAADAGIPEAVAQSDRARRIVERFGGGGESPQAAPSVAAPGAPSSPRPAPVPTLLEYAKSKLTPSVASKITSEKQVESFRAQWEKDYGKQPTPAPSPAPAAQAAVPEVAAPTVTPDASGGIFGYSWDQIRGKQQGGALSQTLRGAAVKPKATEADFKLLEQHGAEWLYDNEKFGVIDRLGLPMKKPEQAPPPAPSPAPAAQAAGAEAKAAEPTQQQYDAMVAADRVKNLKRLKEERKDLISQYGNQGEKHPLGRMIGGLNPAAVKLQSIRGQIAQLERLIGGTKPEKPVMTPISGTNARREMGLLYDVKFGERTGKIGKSNLGKWYAVENGEIVTQDFRTAAEARDAWAKAAKPTPAPSPATPQAGDTATVSLGGRDYPNTTIIRAVKTPEGTKYQVDIFGDKFVTADQLSSVKSAKARPAPEKPLASGKAETIADVLPPDEVASLSTGAVPKSWTDVSKAGDRNMSYRDPRGQVWEIAADYATKTLTLNKQGSSLTYDVSAKATPSSPAPAAQAAVPEVREVTLDDGRTIRVMGDGPTMRWNDPAAKGGPHAGGAFNLASPEFRKQIESAEKAAPAAPAPARIQLKSGPATYSVVEQLPPQKGDQPGEVYFRVKNERTGEEQTVEAADMKPVKAKGGKIKVAESKTETVVNKVAEKLTATTSKGRASLAKEIKDDLIAKLEKHIETARGKESSDAARIRNEIDDAIKRESKTSFIETLKSQLKHAISTRDVVIIRSPKAGTFAITVQNDAESLGEVLSRVKKLSTTLSPYGAPTDRVRGNTAKQQAGFIEAARNPDDIRNWVYQSVNGDEWAMKVVDILRPKLPEIAKLEAEAKELIGEAKGMKRKLDADESGGIPPEGFHSFGGIGMDEFVDFGAKIWRKGMDFARWAAEMIRYLGEKIAPILRKLWRSLTGQDIHPEFRESGAIFGAGRRRRGRQPDALPQEERFLTTRGFYEGSADVFLKKPLFNFLGKAINKQIDLADKRLGDTMGKIEAWEARTGGAAQKEAKATLSNYIAAREDGRTADAANILAGASPAATDLIKTIGEIATYTGRISTTLVQPNGRVGVEVVATGGIRKLVNMGDKFWPRILKGDYEAVLRDPLSDPARWQEMIADLIANGNAATPAEAEQFLKGGSTNDADSDFLGSLYRGRSKDRMPAKWYDTSLEGFEDWAVKWSDIVSKIEAFGQKIRPNDTNQFDEALKLTSHAPTQSFINSVASRAYNERNVGTAAKYLLDAPRLLASGLFLTNPVTIGINALSSKVMNTFTYGLAANFARNPLAMFSKKNHLDAYALGALKRDMVRLLYRDDVPGLDALKNFTNGAMTISGYRAVENLTRVDSYLTALAFLHDGLGAVRRKPDSNAAMQFMAFVKRNGYDIAAIVRENGTGDATDTFLRGTIRDTQGGYAYNQVPWWTDTPLGRFMLQFSKFSTMFTRNVMRNVIKPAFVGTRVTVKVGGKTVSKRVFNVKPLLYFLLGSALGGEAISFLKDKAFGIERKDATLEEIANTMDESTRDGLVLIAKRVVNDMLTMGMLGIFGTPIQNVKDVSEQTKIRNPLAPPGVSMATNLGGLVQTGWEQGKLTPEDVGDFLKSSVSMYRYGDAFVKEQSRNAGLEWASAQLKSRRDDAAFIRSASKRYAIEAGLPAARKTSQGRIGKTETTPMRRDLMDALMIGDEFEARNTVIEYLAEFPSIAEKKEKLRSLQASVAQNQPVKVGGIAGNERRIEFMAWAKKNLSAADVARIEAVDETYRKTANSIGLMTVPTAYQDERQSLKTAREMEKKSVKASEDENAEFLERNLRPQSKKKRQGMRLSL